MDDGVAPGSCAGVSMKSSGVSMKSAGVLRKSVGVSKKCVGVSKKCDGVYRKSVGVPRKCWRAQRGAGLDHLFERLPRLVRRRYRGTLLIIKRPYVRPYSRPMPTALRKSWGWRVFGAGPCVRASSKAVPPSVAAAPEQPAPIHGIL